MRGRDRSLPPCMKKRFYRVKEGSKMYGVKEQKFRDMAQRAGAVYKLDKVVLVNKEILDAYLNPEETTNDNNEEREAIEMTGRDRSLAKEARKKFLRYKEAADYYSLSQTKFMLMAKDAGACYKLDKVVLVNCDIFEEYLETFKMP